jgi:cytochrome P450
VIPDINSKRSLLELESLPLLDAFIKECLRITCPVRGRLLRVVPLGNLQVGDVFLPSSVGGPLHAVRSYGSH